MKNTARESSETETQSEKEGVVHGQLCTSRRTRFLLVSLLAFGLWYFAAPGQAQAACTVNAKQPEIKIDDYPKARIWGKAYFNGCQQAFVELYLCQRVMPEDFWVCGGWTGHHHPPNGGPWYSLPTRVSTKTKDYWATGYRINNGPLKKGPTNYY